MKHRTALEEITRRPYRFDVIADPEVGGYVIRFPDLPGCMTQVDSIEEVSDAAKEIQELWLETAYETGVQIPEPSYPETHSGKFNVRLPKSLHRRLAERAQDEGVSLNQLVVALLAGGIEQASYPSVEPERERTPRSLAAVGD
jgi:predicted RNase H-like HicB family nuclease